MSDCKIQDCISLVVDKIAIKHKYIDVKVCFFTVFFYSESKGLHFSLYTQDSSIKHWCWKPQTLSVDVSCIHRMVREQDANFKAILQVQERILGTRAFLNKGLNGGTQGKSNHAWLDLVEVVGVLIKWTSLWMGRLDIAAARQWGARSLAPAASSLERLD